jgi:SAM-dependent methyltransferase
VQKRFEDAGLSPNMFDRIFCISVIEHMRKDAALQVMEGIEQALRPGGLAVMTVDLFLDLHPFTETLENDTGTNMEVSALMSAAKLDLVFGCREELYGYKDFVPEAITRRVPEFLVGDFRLPVVSQCFMARKPYD